MKQPANGDSSGAAALNSGEGGENVKIINPEPWQACAGPLVNLPPAGTHVVYFPQGHSEQADPETDEVYAQWMLSTCTSTSSMLIVSTSRTWL